MNGRFRRFSFLSFVEFDPPNNSTSFVGPVRVELTVVDCISFVYPCFLHDFSTSKIFVKKYLVSVDSYIQFLCTHIASAH